jgi:predicted permease
MFWLRLIYSRLYGLLRKNRIEQDMEEEMRFHLRMRTRENIERGMRPEEAEREARRRFGNVGHIKDLGRDIKGGGFMETLRQDLRYGARMLMKNPGFTLIAVITLALGIGANTAIFSVVNAVLLRPLPFKEPDRLMAIFETRLPQFQEMSLSPGNFLDWKEQNTVFERLVAYRSASFNLIGTGDPQRLPGISVTEGFLALLGAQPRLGRDFSPEEYQREHANVVILSHWLWERRFGGDPKVLGQEITLDGRNYTIVGVMPATFAWATGLLTPMAFTAQEAQDHGSHYLAAIGRLKPGVTLDQARAEMSAIAGRLAAQYPGVNRDMNVRILPLLELTVRDVKTALLVLFVAVAFVLLIACVNVVNLMLARVAERQKEIGIRVALGAGRARIVRQLLTESALLALLGGAAGLLLAKYGRDLLLALAPQNLPRVGDASLDGSTLAFTAVITLLTGTIFGLVPALQVTNSRGPNLNETLKDAGRVATESRRRRLMRNALIVLEVASALVLLVGAGLMIKSLWRLQKVDPGFDPERALTVSVALPRRKYPEANRQAAFFQQLIEKVGTLPGVQTVGATSILPLSAGDDVSSFGIQGRPSLPPEFQSTNIYSVSSGYFKAMGIRLIRGRLFTERDTKDSPRIIIINEWIAKTIFLDEDPIGKQIRIDNQGDIWFEIVGIVSDVKLGGIDRATPLQTYLPYTQRTLSNMTLIVRAEGRLAGLTAAIRKEVLQLDKEQPISGVRTLNQVFSASIAQRRFSTLLLGVFAAVALALAAVGVYGVLSYAVTQRTHEIGIRMALGAGRRDVLKLVVGRGMFLTLIGMAAGLAAAFALTRVMSALLFEVSATDRLTFGSSALLLGAVALLACWIPARRATKVDPLTALKHE